MTKLRFFAFTLLFACALAHAQQPVSDAYTPYNPVGLPAGAPQWMRQLEQVEQVNYYDMVARFRQYLLDVPEARVKTPHTKPIINYFRRWQKTYAPFVTADGSIKLPKQVDFRTFVDEINAAQPQHLAGKAPQTKTSWEVVAPIMTYDWKSKKASPAQSNVQRFDVSASNPDVLYCGTETGMIFKSIDRGLHWLPVAQNHYFGGEITTVEVSRTNPDKVVVGAGPMLWLTTDGGLNWQNITPSQVSQVYRRVRDAVFHPTDDNIIFMGNDAGVYKTSNGGTEWRNIDYGQCFDIKLKKNNPDVVYTLINKSTGMILRKSIDGGVSFQTKDLNFEKRLASGRIGLSDAPTGQDYVYIWACMADAGQSYSMPFYLGTPVLFKSTDSGETWQPNTAVAAQLESHDRSGGQGYYDMVITASPDNPEHLLFGLLHLYESKDGGNTVQNVGGYYGRFDLHCDMQDIKVVGHETWLSTDGGIIYSPDFFGQQAEARINGIFASEMWGFDLGWNEDVMVGGRNHNGNMSQLDRYNGATISMSGSERSTGYVFLSNPRKIAFSDSQNVLMPDDWREEFVPFVGFWHYPYESTQFGIGFEFDPRYAKSFYIIQGSYHEDWKTLWKTVDDGESFVELYKFPKSISSYAVSRSNPDKLVVGTQAQIFYSLDGGKSFVEYTNLPQGLLNTTNYKIAIHPRDENEILVSAHENGQCYRTRDNGATWQHLNKGLVTADVGDQYIITRFCVTGNEKNAVYAVASSLRKLNENYNAFRSRILYRDDTTDGWVDFSEGLPPVITINRMLPFYKEGVLRIATNNGIWQRPLVDTDFKPIAQPLILNSGTGENKGEAQLQFDSYSIVNQKNATWEWQFAPEPLSVSDKKARNPLVRIAAEQSYDVTLTVTTPKGSDTKTIKKMIVGQKDVHTGVAGQELLARDVVFVSQHVKAGQPFRLTPHGLSHEVELKVFDARGTLVNRQTLQATGTQTVSTAMLSAGVYFYMIEQVGFRKTGKLVIR